MTLHDKRELNKIGLDTFTLDVYNMFDATSDQAITKLKDEYRTLWLKYNDAKKISDAKPKSEAVDDQSVVDELIGEQDAGYYMMDIIYCHDEMISFFEMKIIYAFKHVEINIKRLISASYSDAQIKNFFQWNNLIGFLKTKMIKLEELSGYQEINQLRQVNNVVKHGADVEDLEKIIEFKNQKAIKYESLEAFYQRIKEAPIKFLSALSGAIYAELYEFSDERIKSMVESFVLRMDEETAKKFIQNFSSHYF